MGAAKLLSVPRPRSCRALTIICLVLGAAFMLASCTRTAEKAEEEGTSFRGAVEPSTLPALSSAKPEVAASVPAVWRPLAYRLAMDGLSGADIDDFFARMGGAPSQEPMGRKIKELYTKKFVRRPVDPSAPLKPRPMFYKNVLTAENAAKCRDFINANAEAFAAAAARFGVPQDIAAALLFVETRLGSSLGAQPAAFTLASMAQSRAPQSIEQWFGELPGYEQHLDWMAEIMPRRADWAYKELRALLVHARANGLDPLSMPGSIYGAIGICQFMPSNLLPYAVDGNGDGVVDLFTVADAIASLSNYLAKHGWRAGISREAQRAILKRYNNADIYANTIMALSDMVAGRELPIPKAAQKAGAGKAQALKAPGKKADAKSQAAKKQAKVPPSKGARDRLGPVAAGKNIPPRQ